MRGTNQTLVVSLKGSKTSASFSVEFWMTDIAYRRSMIVRTKTIRTTCKEPSGCASCQDVKSPQRHPPSPNPPAQ
ncbi:hypothetical protein RISK_000822 [Rhodopirellula islandica]|uniref:Uncharacterized protein n=1 Tax=Rhodopirellula islandica TaxID=595434 RepID=A0A0J1BKF9_RHOIS|nr:hypothetical protein RISK_000822 [Rhodopirellula islandica]